VGSPSGRILRSIKKLASTDCLRLMSSLSYNVDVLSSCEFEVVHRMVEIAPERKLPELKR